MNQTANAQPTVKSQLEVLLRDAERKIAEARRAMEAVTAEAKHVQYLYRDSHDLDGTQARHLYVDIMSLEAMTTSLGGAGHAFVMQSIKLEEKLKPVGLTRPALDGAQGPAQ